MVVVMVVLVGVVLVVVVVVVVAGLLFDVPRRLAVAGKVFQLQIGNGEPDDGGLVQLRRDGGRQRQHLGQFVELVVLLAAPRARRVARLLFPHLQNTAKTTIMETSSASTFLLFSAIIS